MFLSLRDPGTDGVGIAFSDRRGGVSAAPFDTLNLGRTDADDPSAVIRNFRLLREALDLPALVTVNQVHGTAVIDITAADVAAWRPGFELGDAVPGQPPLRVADAVITRESGVGLAVRVADCLPVLFADEEAGVIGAAHAGRQGLIEGVLPATIERLRGIGAKNLTSWVGPHACGACYELPEAMVAELAARWPDARRLTANGTSAADLGAIAASQLAAGGCEVVRMDVCTMTTPTLFSHRRDGAATGRQVGVIWRRRGGVS
ncbi:MAG: peptidoglycan editing factor PgeF [Propionibacteriaceae bacterium]|nr:peptidoglycan editing factor PgeF [Propionibacteriaceae bacterium]HBY23057.1 peptidoglycan editing factor PgeF [Propionibacteriaceae bacterium]